MQMSFFVGGDGGGVSNVDNDGEQQQQQPPMSETAVRADLFRAWREDLDTAVSLIDDAEEQEEDDTDGAPPRTAALTWLRNMVHARGAAAPWHLLRPSALLPMVVVAGDSNNDLQRRMFQATWDAAAAACLLSGVIGSDAEQRARTNAEVVLDELLEKHLGADDEARLERLVRDLVHVKYTTGGAAALRVAPDILRLRTPRPGAQMLPPDWADLCASMLYVAEYIVGATAATRAATAPVAWRFQTALRRRITAAPEEQQPQRRPAVEGGAALRRRITPMLLRGPQPPAAGGGDLERAESNVLPEPRLDLAESVSAALARVAARRQRQQQRDDDDDDDEGAAAGRRRRVYDAIDALRQQLRRLNQRIIDSEQLRQSFITDGSLRAQFDRRTETYIQQLHTDVRALAATAVRIRRSSGDADGAAAAAAAEAVREAVAVLGPPHTTVEQLAGADDGDRMPLSGVAAEHAALMVGGVISLQQCS